MSKLANAIRLLYDSQEAKFTAQNSAKGRFIMVYRQNYEVPLGTRVDRDTKREFDRLAVLAGQKPAELLRKIVADYIKANNNAPK